MSAAPERTDSMTATGLPSDSHETSPAATPANGPAPVSTKRFGRHFGKGSGGTEVGDHGHGLRLAVYWSRRCACAAEVMDLAGAPDARPAAAADSSWSTIDSGCPESPGHERNAAPMTRLRPVLRDSPAWSWCLSAAPVLPRGYTSNKPSPPNPGAGRWQRSPSTSSARLFSERCWSTSPRHDCPTRRPAGSGCSAVPDCAAGSRHTAHSPTSRCC